jgi:site-specific DNA-methyltransferase (adenine-specific)
MTTNQLMLGDCLDRMREIPDGSVDLVLADLPYGTTQNKWDSVIPLDRLWPEYWRVCGGAVVLTASQPFTGKLVVTGEATFRHAWVWVKSAATGHLNARRMPMKLHEDVLVFSKTAPTYNPQGLQPLGKIVKRGGSGGNFGAAGTENFQEWTNYPRSILHFPHEGKPVHPTQKPVALMEYLIRTYTNEGDTVLDNTMGSGTTGVACVNTGRRFIGIERDEGYFQIAEERIRAAELSRLSPVGVFA